MKDIIMIASLMLNGILHKVVVNHYSNKRSTARVHTVKNEPIALFTSVGKDKFIDDINHKVYTLNPMTRVMVGC